MSASSIETKLSNARSELLDLSFRNPLLNYRPLKARGAEFLPAEAYPILEALIDGKSLELLSRDRTPKARSKPPLITDYTPEELQKRLLKTFYDARTTLEEQGINTLFLAFGMLRWFESPTSEIPRLSPLYLLPVELHRTNVSAPFELRATGEEGGVNLSLQVKLENEFGLKLPTFEDEEKESDWPLFTAQVLEAISAQTRWSFEPNHVALAFFSFSKFLMFRDLDAAAWPDHAKPGQHGLMQALLGNGFQERPSLFHESDTLDEKLPPASTNAITNADSSQLLAIEDVKAGRNLVIQGPPGTGKSQTITNIIAEALGQGKRVLFVAEKLAALEVVKSRLDALGLGDACLELHSNKANKKAILSELKRTLDLGRPSLPGKAENLELLVEVQRKLNDYSQNLNSPVGQSGLTLHDIFGRYLQWQRTQVNQKLEVPFVEVPALLDKNVADIARLRALVADAQQLLARLRRLDEHPLREATLKSALPADEETLLRELQNSRANLDTLRESTTQLAALLGVRAAEGLEDAQRLVQAAAAWLAAPSLDGLAIEREEWFSKRAELEKLLQSARLIRDLRNQYRDQLRAEAWNSEASEITNTRTVLATQGRKWYRWIFGSWRAANKHLQSLMSQPVPRSVVKQLGILDAILQYRQAWDVVSQQRVLSEELFRSRWVDLDSNTDFDALAEATRWLAETHRQVKARELPAQFFAIAQPPSANQCRLVSERVKLHRDAFIKSVGVSEALLKPRESVLELNNFDAIAAQLTRWQSGISDLAPIASFNALSAQLEAQGLAELLIFARQWPDAGRALPLVFERAWLEALLRDAMNQHPALTRFDGKAHERAIDEFRVRDRHHLRENCARLARAHWDNLPAIEAEGQMRALRREWEKQRAHMPPRRLMERAGAVVQSLKPVFMMSPLSVATYLSPGAVSFDLVIFDEASQVRPVDALGALLRGDKAVVTGDSKQLPPSRFFDRIVQEEGSDDEENTTADMESVLGLFVAQGAPQRTLRWHYRSRHESLIAVSNQEFYSNQLIVFPSPDAGREKLGLVYHHLPQTNYDRGGSGVNREEARLVADAVMRHARLQLGRPVEQRQSLGVAAFSIKQAQEIQDQLEMARRQQSDCEEFFVVEGKEPFFVKNLENVQGDERDVMLLSVGYGRDSSGKSSMNFGPLNNAGGERRLNVLITRARLRCEIFTNLSPDDIDLSRTSALGVSAFKRFLSFAKDGQLAIATPTGREPDSPFEREVLELIRSFGYEVVPQVGCAGYFIDMAVKDPRQSGRFVLGIECDGASYHSARSARDRDRLRAEVLKGMGWNLYRIWSTDWFRQREVQTRHLKAAIEQAILESTQGVEAVPEAAPMPLQAVELEREHTPRAVAPTRVYQKATLTPIRDWDGLSYHALSAWVVEAARQEGPVHQEVVARRLIEVAGIARLGPRIQQKINQAITSAQQTGKVLVSGSFLQVPDGEVYARDRSALETRERSVAFIAPAEMEVALLNVISETAGLDEESAFREALALWGLKTLNAEARERLAATLQELIQRGTVRLENQVLRIVD